MYPNIKKNFGFGFMRLPMIGEEIDLEQTTKMVDAFMAAGFNYFDTAHGYLDQRSKSVELLKNRMTAAQNTVLNLHNQRYLTLAAKLDALSPLKVLTRGYAMVRDTSGEVVRSVKQTAAGDAVEITLRDGIVSATVTQIKENAV